MTIQIKRWLQAALIASFAMAASSCVSEADPQVPASDDPTALGESASAVTGQTSSAAQDGCDDWFKKNTPPNESQEAKTIREGIRNWWAAKGGRPLFGCPISVVVRNPVGGSGPFDMQYFQYARIEHHPEHRNTFYAYELGRLGVERLAQLKIESGCDAAEQVPEKSQGASASNYTVPRNRYDRLSDAPAPLFAPGIANAFAKFWSQHGVLFTPAEEDNFHESVALFGYPVAPACLRGGWLFQYFERGRLSTPATKLSEANPDNVVWTPMGCEVLGYGCN